MSKTVSGLSLKWLWLYIRKYGLISCWFTNYMIHMLVCLSQSLHRGVIFIAIFWVSFIWNSFITLLYKYFYCRAIVREMPPTPSRFHYIFNLRDLSRVCAGLCQTTADAYKHSHEFLRVWRNECLRVFHDRLISVEDQDNVKVNITIITDFYKVSHSAAAYFNQKPVS